MAEKLFQKKGYETTSVDLIIDKVGISKGTFYHYFASKEELLEEIAERFYTKAEKWMKEVFNRKDLNAVQKINHMNDQFREYKISRKKITQTILGYTYKKENSVLRQKFFKEDCARSIPLIARIIQQGINEDLFRCSFPEETAEILLRMVHTFNEAIAQLIINVKDHPENVEKVELKIRLYNKAFERILGADEGSIRAYNMEWKKYYDI